MENDKKLNVGLCKCALPLEDRSYEDLFSRFIEESIEFLFNWNINEFGDMMCIASLITSKSLKRVVILPFAKRSLVKGAERYRKWGCVRSQRNSCK